MSDRYANGAVSGAIQGVMVGSPDGEMGAVEGSGQAANNATQQGAYRSVSLEEGLTPTQAQLDQINNINGSLQDYGRAVHASGNSEAIRDYQSARLIYAPRYMAELNAKAGDGVTRAAARAGGNTIYFGDSPAWTYARSGDTSYHSANLHPMTGRGLRAWMIAHEFGHLHSRYSPILGNPVLTENRANAFARMMTPHIRSQSALSVRIIYGP